MSIQALTVYGTGLVCGVGLNTASACAAIRAGINNFQETRFMDNGGEWIIGCEVPLEQPWRGLTKLVRMACMAIEECMANSEIRIVPADTPVLLCVAEGERPGRLAGLDELFHEIQSELGLYFHEQSSLIPQGRVAGAVALYHSRKLIYEQGIERVLVVGVDSLLIGPSIEIYEANDRLLTSQNSNGFIPGEGASALLLGKPKSKPNSTYIDCLGMGFGIEKATIETDLPFRADALTQAIKSALNEAEILVGNTSFRITDLSGEQYYFKEAAIAHSRLSRISKDIYDLWHPADCVGECGAAIGIMTLVISNFAAKNNFALGEYCIAHFASDNGRRAAFILHLKKDIDNG